jgi:hypothetical protein
MTAALEGGEWSAARLGRTLPQERAGTHCTGGWVGPKAGLDGRKISHPPGRDPRTVQPVGQSLYRLSYPAHTLRLKVHRFSTVPPYTQTSVNFNNLVMQYKEYFMVYRYL